MKDSIKNRIGEIRTMNCGEEAEIIEYKSCMNITVKFLRTGEIVKCRYIDFKRGLIKSHFTPTVYGVGIVGLETTKVNGKAINSYNTWQGILERCYNEKLQSKYPTYKGCEVCDEWKYYSNFKKWYEENYYEIEGQRTALDKDILVKNNKIYSPESCVFVPERINSLFVKNNANRGSLPIGVNWKESNKKYRAYCNMFDIENKEYKLKHLGYFNTPKEAFKVYKKAKEENIKLVAEYYKDCIPNKLYEAMFNYKVEIDD